MNRQLTDAITEQTNIMLRNMRTAIQVCDMDYPLCGMPLWQHIYHTLHSCDKWYINPNGQFTEPSFHRPGLNSLHIQRDTGDSLSRDTLLSYLDGIQKKLELYLAGIRDELLTEKPEGCPYSRITLILGQLRHFNVHLGNINGTTIMQTGKWPRVIGLENQEENSLYD